MNYNSQRVSWLASGFFARYSNYIYLKPTAQFSTLPEGGQLFAYSQTGSTYTGGEMQLNVKVSKRLRYNVQLDAVFNTNTATGIPLPFTPAPRVNSMLEFKPKESWKVWVSHTYSTEQNRVDRNEMITPAYQLVDLGTSGVWHFNRAQVQWSVTLQNALDKRYLNHLSRYRLLNLPEQGRNWVFTLKVPVNWSY